MDILPDLTDAALARANRQNLYNFFRSFQHVSLTDVYLDAHLVRWGTPLAHPWMNGVLATQVAPNDVATSIAYFDARHAPIFTWWNENAQPNPDDARVLQAHGLHYDANMPGMAIELATLKETNLPADVQIVRVADEALTQTWVRVCLEGFGLPAHWYDHFLVLTRERGLALPMRYYLALWRGDPVAASSLFLSAGVAGIYFVATLEHARGRGIGAAITHAALADARALGYRAGILQASNLGRPMYERLGFRTVCQLDHFYYKPQ